MQRTSRDELNKLLQEVDKLVIESERVTTSLRDAANELSKSANASYSAAGDREHAENQAQMNEERHAMIITFKSEVRDALNQEVPAKISPICFVELKYQDSRQISLYLVNSSVHIERINLVTPESPLGKAILGKKIGESFKYEVEGRKIEGKILEIE